MRSLRSRTRPAVLPPCSCALPRRKSSAMPPSSSPDYWTWASCARSEAAKRRMAQLPDGEEKITLLGQITRMETARKRSPSPNLWQHRWLIILPLTREVTGSRSRAGRGSDVRYIAQHRCHINYSFDINFLMTNDKLWYNASMNWFGLRNGSGGSIMATTKKLSFGFG